MDTKIFHYIANELIAQAEEVQRDDDKQNRGLSITAGIVITLLTRQALAIRAVARRLDDEEQEKQR